MPANIYPVKFINSPSSRTVTAIMNDDSQIIIESLSNDNYVDYPMEAGPNFDETAYKYLIQLRIKKYYSMLNIQLSS